MLLCGRANSSSGLRTDVRCHIPPNPGRSGKEDRDERRLYRSFDSRVRMEYKVPYGGYTLYMYCILLWSFNYARFSGAAKNTRGCPETNNGLHQRQWCFDYWGCLLHERTVIARFQQYRLWILHFSLTPSTTDMDEDAIDH